MKRLFIMLCALVVYPVWAEACPSYPYSLSNGTTADASQVMSNFNTVMGCASSAVFPSSVNVWSAGQSSAPVALAFNTTITPDFSTGNIFTVTLTGNATLANPNNLAAGQCGQLFVTQDSTGSRTLAYGSEWKFPGGTAPTLTTTPNATDILSFCSWSTTQIAAQLTSNVK